MCVEMSGAAVDWLLLLMTGMLIREIFIDPPDSEMSQTHSTHTQQHVHTQSRSALCRLNEKPANKI